MKRILSFLMTTVLAIGICTSCGSSETIANPTPQEIVDALLKEVSFEEQLVQLSEEEIDFKVTMEDGVEGLMYISGGSTAEEIAVFKAPDKNSAKRMLNGTKEYLDAQKSSFADYLPEEVKRIEDAVLVQKGNYVVLCVCAQTDTAKSVIDEAFK